MAFSLSLGNCEAQEGYLSLVAAQLPCGRGSNPLETRRINTDMCERLWSAGKRARLESCLKTNL